MIIQTSVRYIRIYIRIVQSKLQFTNNMNVAYCVDRSAVLML